MKIQCSIILSVFLLNFIICAPFYEQEKQKEPLIIFIMKDGNATINNGKIFPSSEIGTTFRNLGVNKQTRYVIRGDKGVDYSLVKSVISTLIDEGYSFLAFQDIAQIKDATEK